MTSQADEMKPTDKVLVVVILFSIASYFPVRSEASAYSECRKEWQALFADWETRRQILMKMEGKGKRVKLSDVGKCSKRLRALSRGAYGGTTFENFVSIKEDMNCLQLAMDRVADKCSCRHNLGKQYDEHSRDEAEQAMIEIFRIGGSIQEAGIKNPAVKKLVKASQKLMECSTYQSIQEMREIEKILKRELSL